MYLWGAQFETGSYPTSYIPSAGSQGIRWADQSSSIEVTRVADEASITGTNFSSWYNQNEGSLMLQFSGQTYTSANYKRLVSITDAESNSMSAGNQISFGSHGGIDTQRWLTRNGSSIAYIPLASNPPVTKTAIGFKSPEQSSVTYDGADIVTYAITSAIPTANNRLDFYGTQMIKRLTYWPKRLTDTSLQYLTQ